MNKAIDKLKNGKAAGQDAIIAEVLKWAGESMRRIVWKMCCVAWSTEKVPHEWMQGLVFPLYKDGDDRDLLNYRGITLLSIVAKVYCSVLTDRLRRRDWSSKEALDDRRSVVCASELEQARCHMLASST